MSRKIIKEHQELYESLINDENIKQLLSIPQHRGSNTYIHSLKVCKYAYKLARRSVFEINYADLILGALLHDFYLYDWRTQKDKKKHHAHRHPYIALENAKKYFAVNSKVENIIVSHMWPINFFKFQKSREAILVSIADKHVSLREAMTSKKYKRKRVQETIESLKTLY